MTDTFAPPQEYPQKNLTFAPAPEYPQNLTPLTPPVAFEPPSAPEPVFEPAVEPTLADVQAGDYIDVDDMPVPVFSGSVLESMSVNQRREYAALLYDVFPLRTAMPPSDEFELDAWIMNVLTTCVLPLIPAGVTPSWAQDPAPPREQDLEAANLDCGDPYVIRDWDGQVALGGGDVFARIDKNNDGLITKEEFMRAMEGAPERDPEIGVLLNRSGAMGGADYTLPGYDFEGPEIKLGGKLDLPDVDLRGLDLDSPDVRAYFEGLGINPDIDLDVNLDVRLGKIDMPRGPCDGFADCCDDYCDRCEARCHDVPLFLCSKLFGFCGCPDFGVKFVSRFFTKRLPWLFSLLCLLLFSAPVGLTYRMSQDMQVRYWITDELRVILVLPLLYVMTQWVHYKQQRPNRILICICLAGSCAFLLLLADLVLLSSYHKANALSAKDCNTDVEKKALQLQWQNAQTFYQSCMAETASKSGSNPEVAYSLYRIQDCEGYRDQLGVNPAWPYLGALEQEYQCGGWCVRSQPLWTFKGVKDSCAMTVADVLYNKVQWSMLQVIAYTTVVLGFVSAVLVQVGPILRSHNIEW